MELARKASKLYVAKGKSINILDTRGASDSELAAHLLGPTGNLRAPTMVVGKKLLVGFNQEAYEEVFD